MSTLISSAVGGKKATAPRGAVRRRAPPPAAAHGQSEKPAPEADSAGGAAPPSPPPTQHSTGTRGIQVSDLPTPRPEIGAEPRQPVELLVQELQQSSLRQDPIPQPDPTAPEAEETSITHRAGPASSQPPSSTKRKHGAASNEDSELPPGPKKVKRSSARSNTQVTAVASEEAEHAINTRATRRATRRRESPSNAEKTSARIDDESAPRRKQPKAVGAAPAALDAASETPHRQRTRQKASGKGLTDDTETANTEAAAQPHSLKIRTDTARKRNGAVKQSSTAGKAGTEVTGVEDEAAQQPAQPERTSSKRTARKPRKRKITSQDSGADGEQENQEVAVDEQADSSDPEMHEIDPHTMTMSQIVDDRRHGKSSERERRMAEIDWDEVARKRRDAIDEAYQKAMTSRVNEPRENGAIESTEGLSGTAETTATSDAQEELEPAASDAARVRYTIVHGQIVEEETTLTIDRRAKAEAEVATTADAVEEETDLTKRVNRMTHLNDRRRAPVDRLPFSKLKNGAWNDDMTDRFYDALRMFGTDFSILANMFAPKSRKMIKMKFIREERLDPQRVNAALLGKESTDTPMDLEHYAREVGTDIGEFTKYESLAQAEADIQESLKGKAAEVERAISEAERNEVMETNERKKREKGKAGGKGAKGGKKSAADKEGVTKKKQGARKKKGAAAEATEAAEAAVGSP